jgi:hypothetical protein
VSVANPNMILLFSHSVFTYKPSIFRFRWGSFHSPQPTWLYCSELRYGSYFHAPVWRARASPPESGAASLLFEPEARKCYGKTSERSEQGYIFAPGELGERRFRREAQGVFAPSGRLFFGDFLLAVQKKVTQGAGAEPPAISF